MYILGFAAAERLMAPVDDIGIRDIEGPERYASQDVADAFAEVLGRGVWLEATSRGQWKRASVVLRRTGSARISNPPSTLTSVMRA